MEWARRGTQDIQAIDLTKTPNDIALASLACLPDDATFKHKHAKTLFKAFDLVKAELQHRLNDMSQMCQQTGSQEPLLFCNEQVTEVLRTMNYIDYG
jgi:hypothetical protein